MTARNPTASSRVTRLILGLVSLLLFTGGFYSNRWSVARPAWFEGFQRGTECHVLGRLVKSRQDGILSAGGLLGVGVVRFERPAEPSAFRVHFRRVDVASGLHVRTHEDWPGGPQIDEQYKAYLDGSRFEIFAPYASQNGGQGMLFSLLDGVLPVPNRVRLALYHLLTAFLSAAALAAIVLWFAREHSLGVGAVVLASTLLSHWLVGFGGNLWWGLWAFYLPFVAVCHFESGDPSRPRRYATLALVAFAGMLAKCLINGYEFVTTTLVMLAIPSVYHAIRRRARPVELLKTMLALGIGAAAAVAASLALLVAQLSSLRGSLRFGVRHILFSFTARTLGSAEDFPPAYAPGLNASHWSVLETYLRGPYWDLSGRSAALDAALPSDLLALPYAYLLAGFAVASVLLGWLSRNADAGDKRRAFALIATTWVSILAPLSWLVLFKAHSYEHAHMNFVVWQMPFTLFGFAVCGALGVRLGRRILRSDGPQRSSE